MIVRGTQHRQFCWHCRAVAAARLRAFYAETTSRRAEATRSTLLCEGVA